ncbi:MAG: dodecin [Persicimonas sp.]
MPQDHVYKIVKLVGSSTDSIEHAIDQAIAKAGESVRNMRWFELDELRGHIEDGEVAHYQVKIDVGFTLED